MFFKKNIDFANLILNFDRSPVCINIDTNLTKVHFLFNSLNISTIFVLDDKSFLQGIIKRNSFIDLNK